MVNTKTACVLLVVLAGAAAGSAAGRQVNRAPGRGPELAWSIEGRWTGVAADESAGTIYACGVGRCAELGREGKTLRAFRLDVSCRIDRVDVLRQPRVRLAKLGPATKALLLFDIWSRVVVACDTNGRRLWTHDAPMGVDDVWAGDIDADGRDEVIVGHNGRAGLHVLDSGGRLLWKTTAIGNVWNVSAGPVWGDGTLQVVASAAGGKVHIFSTDGSRHVVIDAGHHVSAIRVVRLPDEEQPTILAVDGAPAVSHPMTALFPDGTRKWSTVLPGGRPPTWFGVPAAESFRLLQGLPWLAVGMTGGQVDVVDVTRGEVIAIVEGEATTWCPEIDWAPGAGARLLLVAGGGALRAYRLNHKLDSMPISGKTPCRSSKSTVGCPVPHVADEWPCTACAGGSGGACARPSPTR